MYATRIGGTPVGICQPVPIHSTAYTEPARLVTRSGLPLPFMSPTIGIMPLKMVPTPTPVPISAPVRPLKVWMAPALDDPTSTSGVSSSSRLWIETALQFWRSFCAGPVLADHIWA